MILVASMFATQPVCKDAWAAQVLRLDKNVARAFFPIKKIFFLGKCDGHYNGIFLALCAH
jgi:hypothetical protein